MTKSNAPIIGDVRFLKYGADAPDESRFKGKISTESVFLSILNRKKRM